MFVRKHGGGARLSRTAALGFAMLGAVFLTARHWAPTQPAMARRAELQIDDSGGQLALEEQEGPPAAQGDAAEGSTAGAEPPTVPATPQPAAAAAAGGEQHGARPRERFADCAKVGLGPSASTISPSLPLSHVASRWSPGLGHVGGLSDPTIVAFSGHYIAAFTDAYVTKVYFAASRDGSNWTVSSTVLDGYSWTSLFVHGGQLYLLGPEGQLWFRKETTNDLQLSRLEFVPPAALREAGRTKLTQGMGVHVLNNVPLVVGDAVTFPFMVAPASTKWDPISIHHFVTANESLLDQGMHAVEVSEGEVLLRALDWDASVFGAVVGPHRLGRNAFVRFEDGSSNATLYARVVGLEGDTLWLVPEKWNTDCRFELKNWACKSSMTRGGGAGAARLTVAGSKLWPDSPIYQEFLLGVLQNDPRADLMDAAAWSMSRLVGNPVMRYPQAHRLWAGPSIQERSVGGSIRRCTGTGVRECIYWQEPVAFASRGGGVRVAVRLTTDQNCNSALLCSLGSGGAGALECDKFAAVPGFGNVRGYVFFDAVSHLYWALNNFNVDTTTKGSGKGFVRAGQRCFDQRGNVGLFYSGDMHNWVLAQVVTKANSNKLALPYSSCTVQGGDLLCVGKTNGNLDGASGCIIKPAGDHHSSKLIVAFRIHNFRQLVH